ncbi:hypothetical protein IFM89_012045 [Coptis chinensis]|uniref:F-box domain-containing protein n=1 Tax=Coptis chinensis TaxID=261450 RepID=A0A835M9J7_9MAGN|nr:hypothetical protein IFM89_012045 [Coptis chinensis]
MLFDGETRETIGVSSNEVIPSLLPEIVSDILSRLPIEDIMRSKTVCKDWYALTKDPHFINLHLSRALCLPRRIIVEPRGEVPITSLYLIETTDGMWRGRELPVSCAQGNYLYTLAYCHGLICGASSFCKMGPLFIYNPITREYVELPETDIEAEPDKLSVSLGFGFDSIGKKYKVVRFFKLYDDDLQTHMKGEIITLGEGSWRGLEVPETVICGTRRKPVFLDETLYWITEKNSFLGGDGLLAFDLSTEKFRTVKFPSSLIRSINIPDKLFLLNLGETLFLVEHGYRHCFRVWRIVRSNTKKGYKFYESFHSMTVTYDVVGWSMKVMERWIDNTFLFHLKGALFRSKIDMKDHLSLYFPEKDEFQIVEVLRIPEFFEPTLFVPCLVSPCSAHNDGAQENNFN